MKKNGFVLVESIVVLVVVALSLSMLISSYSLVTRKTKEKEYYDKASDKYLLYSISNIGTDDNCNYSIKCEGSAFNGISGYKDTDKITFRSDKDNTKGYGCSSTKIGKLIYNCESVFEEMHIVHIYVVKNIIEELNSSNATSFFDSGTLEYMKSLKKCKDVDYRVGSTTCSDSIAYLIGVFERANNEYHYAAIEIANPE